MEIFIKVTARPYEQLRNRIPNQSPAYEAIDKATRIDYSVDGMLFEGYNIPCNEGQAQIILETAKQCCPEIISDIQKAITRARD